MPLYEYQCEQCDGVFEVIQKFADEPLTNHDNCGGKVHRLLSAPAFLFKGSGFYVNDYAKSSGKPGGGSSNKEDSGKKEDSGSKEHSGKEHSGKKEDAGAKSTASDSGTAASESKGSSDSKPKSTSDTKTNS